MSNEPSPQRMLPQPEYKTNDRYGSMQGIMLWIAVFSVLGGVGAGLAMSQGSGPGAICFFLSMVAFVLSVISGQIAELIAVTKQRPHAGQLPNPLPVVAQRGDTKQNVTPPAPPTTVRE